MGPSSEKIMNIDEMILTGDAKLLPQDDRYAVTKCGEVFSKANGGRPAKNPKWRKIKLNQGNGAGRYLAFNLGAGCTKLLHRIIAETFLGTCPEGHDIRHLDGNYFNNCISNLSFGTRKQNMADAIAHGTTCKGERNARSILTIEQVKQIKQLLGYKTVTEVANHYSVSVEAIYQIRAGTRWGWVK